MKRINVTLILAALFIITSREFHLTNGIYLLGNQLEDGDMETIGSTDSNMLDNYCHSCKWGKP